MQFRRYGPPLREHYERYHTCLQQFSALFRYVNDDMVGFCHRTTPPRHIFHPCPHTPAARCQRLQLRSVRDPRLGGLSKYCLVLPQRNATPHSKRHARRARAPMVGMVERDCFVEWYCAAPVTLHAHTARAATFPRAAATVHTQTFVLLCNITQYSDAVLIITITIGIAYLNLETWWDVGGVLTLLPMPMQLPCRCVDHCDCSPYLYDVLSALIGR